jgi:hypothetical protein
VGPAAALNPYAAVSKPQPQAHLPAVPMAQSQVQSQPQPQPQPQPRPRPGVPSATASKPNGNLPPPPSLPLPMPGGAAGKGTALSKEQVAVAKYTFEPTSESELRIEPGEKVVVTEHGEHGWWRGSVGSKAGWFPSAYVEPVKVDDLPPPVLALTAETPTGASFAEPDMMLAGARGPTAAAAAASKFVPPVAAQKQPPDSSSNRSSHYNVPKSVPQKDDTYTLPPPPPAATPETPAANIAVALHSYTALTDVELTFNAGDAITIIAEGDNGWWSGTIDGRSGWFPAGYVEQRK